LLAHHPGLSGGGGVGNDALAGQRDRAQAAPSI
jgi:hypothetical protein